MQFKQEIQIKRIRIDRLLFPEWSEIDFCNLYGFENKCIVFYIRGFIW